MSIKNHKIGILGLGQMGGALAGALKANHPIYGYDINKSLITAAFQKNIISGKATSIEDLIEESEIVILALPIGAIIEVLIKHSESLGKKKMVADLGSIRTPIQNASLKIKITNHVGIHPICGSNLRREEAWNPNLFKGANCFVFPGKYTKPDAIVQAEQIVRLIGGKSVNIDYRKHDELFSITSGLPHILAFSLMRIWNESNSKHPGTAGPSFKSATRVSSSESEMVAQILYYNRVNVRIALTKLEKTLSTFKSVLSNQEPHELKQILEKYAKES